MADDSRVRQLLEEALDSGLGPEEVCRAAGAAELLPRVRRRWQRLCRLQDQLDSLFSQPEPALPAGRAPGELPVLSGYEVQAVLGRGGMGVVYRARHLRLQRTVALKMLLAGPSATAEERERFLREARAVAGLRHPNIVQVHDVNEVDGQPYFTMEYVEGGSLAQKLAGAPQPARQAAVLVATLAEAVQVAHQGGIIHRDLKPANVLLAADGTPRITDFGLARQLEGGGEITLSGVPMGTPSYMAPEQARGQREAVGPATDVYALGAILYEGLTGRPPFRAETAVATLQQVVADEPVPPARLNPPVPRDLETICLKCLHKEPHRRYAGAQALADDLHRFGRGEPIAARPPGRLERLARWVWRRPAQAAGLAASLLLAIALVGGGWWLTEQQAATKRAVEKDLDEVARLQKASDWDGAGAALDRAKDRLGAGGPAALRHRLDQAGRNLRLVARLDAIRLDRATLVEGRSNNAKADRDYEAAFREAGLGDVSDDPEAVADRVAASDVRQPLVAALDDWAVCAADKRRQGWLLGVARRADPDAWRDRVRDPVAWGDRAALAELARTAAVDEQPVHLLMALGERLQATGGEATGFLRRVQLDHPADFWANFTLGTALDEREPGGAVGYYRAALALRPEAVAVSYNLGNALATAGRLDEAIHHYEWVLRINPRNAWAHTGLGHVLERRGRLDEAIDHYQKAIDRYEEVVRLDPGNAWAHLNLGISLKARGRLDEARDHFQQAVTLDPTNTTAQQGLRTVLLRLGRGEEVRLAWQKALEADPPDHDAWYGYAELCLFLGQEDEYRRARRAMLARFGASTHLLVAERTGRACLLLPASGDELRTAAALIDRVLASDRSRFVWAYRYFLFAKGLADYRQGRLDSAIATLEGDASKVMQPAPRLVLAMAKHRQGQKEAARKALATAILAFDWTAPQADNLGAWICHVLRREAEGLILPDLPAFLQGKYEPRDNDERVALLGACQFKNLRRTAARLYADAFAADPKLAEDLKAETRYRAARCAAVAGSGSGADGAGLSEPERARWRKQARQWLRLDLAAWTKRLETAKPTDRAEVRKTLARWREDPDLAGLRDPSALEKLPPAERQECLALWRGLDALFKRVQASR
jgi:serine/threonine-protein kinase